MPLKTTNPTTGDPLVSYDTMSDADVDAAVQRAAEAFTRHRATSFSDRAEKMRAAADLLDEHQAKYATLMTHEMGKPIGQARSEIEKCAWVCRHYAEHAEAYLAPEQVSTDASSSYVAFQPLGPVLAIMPWNYPFWQVFRFTAPGLMAGNVGLLKHAENVTGCAYAIESVLHEAGFETGVFQTLAIKSEAVADLIADDRIRAATLTGSERAGEAVGKQAGAALKPSVLELGGSDPFIVLADADLDHALDQAVTGRMQNNGQSCIAAKRFIVERPVAQEFTDRFVARIERLTVGDPMDEETDVGPLARADLRDGLADQVRRAVEQGAQIATGGTVIDRPGFFYAPTVLTGVEPGTVAFQEELFGPVASIIVADDADHAITLANDTSFGLGGAVFTQDIERGEALALRLDVGCAFVNSMVKSDPRLPFGGVKRSGYGRELGRPGIHAFVNTKTVYID